MSSQGPRIPWTWSDSDRRFYKYDASGSLVWAKFKQTKDRGLRSLSGEGWTYSKQYNSYYKYEYGGEGTVLETLWSYPGPPMDTDADMRTWPRCSEWALSSCYNSKFKLMWALKEDIILKTIWEVPSTKEAEMLINSARKSYTSHRTLLDTPPPVITYQSHIARQTMTETDSGTIGTIATGMKEAAIEMVFLRRTTNILTTEIS